MQIPSLINRGRNSFNMTPMIDVVFLLIIFFLVASHLSDQETQVDLQLPSAESGNLPVSSASRITFSVPSNEQILYAGKAISLDELGQLIEKAKVAQGEDVEVRIRTDRTVAYFAITPILRSCADAGIWNVTFAVYPERGGP